jgi:hypothetical protein
MVNICKLIQKRNNKAFTERQKLVTMMTKKYFKISKKIIWHSDKKSEENFNNFSSEEKLWCAEKNKNFYKKVCRVEQRKHKIKQFQQ